MTTTKLTRHSTTAALNMLPDGVLVVRLTGPLTGEALSYFKARIVALHGADIRAFVADYTLAGLALTGRDLDAVLEGEHQDSAPTLPAALVIPSFALALFRGHAGRMAAHGIVRRVFLRDDLALQWAKRQAALQFR